jgi:ferritin-like metal-binding protein YciE
MLKLEFTMSESMNFRDLFIFNVRRAYDAEKRIIKALPVIRAAATSPELRHAFEAHLKEACPPHEGDTRSRQATK